jgi:antitoxin (DNA-binding transcriptional repressor) of toxin-antitoxin stability system
MAIMRRAKIAELKNNLSRYLDHVRAGGTVLVLDRDEPIAEIVPLQAARKAPVDTDEELLARLERTGMVRRGKGSVSAWLKTHRPVKVRGSVLKDLLDERRSGW